MSSNDINLYGYTPTRSVCIIFVILYSVSTLLHGFQAARSRAWFLLPTVVIAGIAEVVGWGARTKSSYDPFQRTPFIIQTSILVLAPTPFVAALFVGFGRITGRLGAQYSRLSPTLYSRIFLTADIVSLMVQGGGGGIAAGGSNDPDKARLGSNIIIGGLVVQIISMSVFCVFMVEYVWRRINDRPFHKLAYGEAAERQPMDRHMKMLLAGITISTVLVYIRSIYRIIEFADGFNGTIAHTQVLFNVFDGMLVTLAMYTLNFMHPGQLLLATQQVQSYALDSRSALAPPY
ncbi:RTA1 like protein [Polyporus arcularius HHB13444]|uniref:RTA1 like protein n=1 Tax=Polyporus arcularius HHB13444 TaxID=1314778 RepID=A0A5C3PV93_9APHY|nr:RTA1 like protein [Polyporus arcularius HHB13444]